MINVGVTAYNIDNLGIKAFVKTTGKQTAKAMIKSPHGQGVAAQGEEAPKQEHQETSNGKEVQKREEEIIR